MWREIRPRWLALLGLVLVVSACGGEEEPKPDGLLIDPAHQIVSIAPGGVVPVHIKLERTGTLSGAVLVTSSAVPVGLKTESLVLTAEESEGDLVFQASEFAEIGARGRVLVLAQSGSEAYSATVDVEVIAPVAVELHSRNLVVSQTQSAQVEVAIQRAGGFMGPVRLAVQDLPDNLAVTAREYTLEGGSSLATFSFRTNYLTPIGKHSLAFTATAGRFSAAASTELEVTQAASIWDTGFGTNGSLTLPDKHAISSVVTQPDGRILVGAGTSQSNLWIHRLEVDGRPDPTFGQAGVVELASPVANDWHSSPKLVLQPDGKLLVMTESNYDTFLYRLNPDGTRDTTFGSEGSAIADINSYPTQLVLLPDGALLLAARWYRYVECQRLTPQGLKDESYGVSGQVLLPVSDPLSNSALGAFVDGQGRAVLATGYRASDGSTGGLRVFRVTPEGVADTTFGPDGQRTYPLSPHFKPNAFSWLGDGFVALGSVTKDTTMPGEHWLVRLGEQSGTLEYQWKSVNDSWSNIGTALTTLSDGRIMTSMATGLVRTLPTGAVDTSFQDLRNYAWYLFTGQADAVYVVNGQNIRRLMPPR